jgi:hypothetical protein
MSHRALGWAIICLGVALRLRRYLQDRGVMHDEALLATNVLSKSFGQLFRPLDMGDQAAPVGFLILQKCSICCFGFGERSMRLVPLLAAIIVLPLFFLMFRRIAGRAAPLLAITWMALAEPLVYYSSEGKQYSTDVLWTTIVFALAIAAVTQWDLAILAIVGTILLWFSHPLLFVLAAVGASLFIEHVRGRRGRLIAVDIAMVTLWLGSFALNYLTVSRYYAADKMLTTYWAGNFAPLPTTLADVRWYVRALLALFNYPLGIAPAKFIAISAVAAVVFIIGCVRLARRGRGLPIILLSILFTLIASALHKYPFSERLTLFLAPLLLVPLGLAFGGDWRAGGRLAIAVRALLAILLLLYPVYLQAKYFIHPPILYDVKPGLQFIRAHWQRGDVIYLHFGSDVLGRYYLGQSGFQLADSSVVRGIYEPDVPARPRHYADDLLPLQGRPRVWIVFSMAGEADRKLYERILDQRGRLLDRHIYNGGAVELYDLRVPNPAAS